jgi:unsaturated rhamnogalacturonyl hydrolase
MKRKLFAFVLFVYSIAFLKAGAQTVALDYYFNHETHKTKNGVAERFHYMWEDTANSGFSIWGNVFRQQGATLTHIDGAPTRSSLKGTAIYIIVDPDTRKENPHPNYISSTDADNVAQWVKGGGVLVMMANDSANVELQHFNTLAGKFGLHFNDDMQNHVVDDTHFDDGAVMIANNPIFKTAHKAFMKDVCSITISGKGKAVLRSTSGAVIAAVTRYGHGTVFAVADPWLYNEYVNGRLPAGFDNDKAAIDLAKYLISKSH